MPECEHYHGHVSERFASVFANNHGRVVACPNCATNAGIADATQRRTRGDGA